MALTTFDGQSHTGTVHTRRTGQLAFWGAVAFSLIFTLLIAVAGRRPADIGLLPDQGSAWYYWQLPTPTFWTQATAWGGYLLHQAFLWATIAYAQKNVRGYTPGLHPINLVALAGNALFVLLHFVQTQFWYDGLAQNVSLQSSEASVVLLLVVVLIMENRRRGLFFGRKAPLGEAVGAFFRRYHGYLFAWAVVYTFWFHPMVATPGHLVGFFYVFLLLVQASLFFTRMHLNRWWTVTLEVLVLAHGALVVAMLRGSGVWAFVLGFLGIFLITQMHGLKLPTWGKWATVFAYLIAVAAAVSARGILVWRDVALIPALEYALVFVLALLVGGGLWVRRRLAGAATPGAAARQ